MRPRESTVFEVIEDEEEAWESCGRPCEKVGSDDPRRMGEKRMRIDKRTTGAKEISEQKERE